MCVCARVCVCVCVYVCLCVCVHVCVHKSRPEGCCRIACVCARTRICMCVRAHICVCAHTHVCVYLCILILAHIQWPHLLATLSRLLKFLLLFLKFLIVFNPTKNVFVPSKEPHQNRALLLIVTTPHSTLGRLLKLFAFFFKRTLPKQGAFSHCRHPPFYAEQAP